MAPKAMGLTGLVVVVTAALLQTCHLAAAEQESYDLFLFVRQWDPAYCDNAKCRIFPVSADFGIHGLWPEYADGGWPQFCDKSAPFNEQAIADMLPALEKNWPSFSLSDDNFWKHEWEKHGTCAEDVFGNEHDYFKAILDLNAKYDILAAFEAHSITPSTKQTYQAQDMIDAIQSTYGAVPKLTCKKNELSEIQMCLTHELELVDCSSYQAIGTGNCGPNVQYPPLHSYKSVPTTASQ